MLLDTIHGVIERRILLNYRIDAAVASAVIPPPFEPKLEQGYAVAGICLIRFRDIRPRPLPTWMGVSSENAAHRFAVEWTENGEYKQGVYIPHRDTNSRLSKALGGIIFPGIFHHSEFEIEETATRLAVKASRSDGSHQIEVVGSVSSQLPATSIFDSLESASDFFREGSRGYSATQEPGTYHGLELQTVGWSVTPIHIEVAKSYYFDDPSLFPPGSIELDCALLMRNTEHSWNVLPELQALSIPLTEPVLSPQPAQI